MKNNKGFTLIELLAVIVVLAVIALIATPMVLNTIDEAKKGALEQSANAVVNDIENQIAISMIHDSANVPEEFKTVADLSLKGDKPICVDADIANGIVTNAQIKFTSGTVEFKDGKISLSELGKNDPDAKCTAPTTTPAA